MADARGGDHLLSFSNRQTARNLIMKKLYSAEGAKVQKKVMVALPWFPLCCGSLLTAECGRTLRVGQRAD